MKKQKKVGRRAFDEMLTPTQLQLVVKGTRQGNFEVRMGKGKPKKRTL